MEKSPANERLGYRDSRDDKLHFALQGRRMHYHINNKTSTPGNYDKGGEYSEGTAGHADGRAPGGLILPGGASFAW